MVDAKLTMPPAFSLLRLKQLRKILPKLRKLPQEAREVAAKNRAAFEKIIPSDFTWSYLYELSVVELNLLSAMVMGILDRLDYAYKAGLDLNSFLIDAAVDDKETELNELVDKWDGGFMGQFSKADVVAVQFAANGMMLSLGIYGQYLNDLVAKVRNGKDQDDDAFFKAVKIDRTVLTCPVFAARLAKAELYGERKFIHRLHRAIKGKPHDSLLMYQDLRFFLQLLHEGKVLPTLTMAESDFIFIQELKLYNEANDPARSLTKFIERWQKERPQAT